MRRIYGFVGVFALGALSCFGAMNYHIVRAQDGFHLVQKNHARLGGAYVDTRSFDAATWGAHPDLVLALRADNEQMLVNEAAPGVLQGGIARFTGSQGQTTR
jgi:hypothetical protein